MTKTNRTWAGVAALLCVIAAPVWGHPHADEANPNLEEILDGLERGMVALEQIERERELEMLRRVAEEVRIEMRVDGAAKHLAAGQLEALRLAMVAFREKGHTEAIELTTRAIRAREVYLEGRSDREAREINRRGPRREQCIELMNLATNLYREFGAMERAEQLRRLTDESFRRRNERERRGERERGNVENRIEVMRLALPALLEADRRDAADLLEHAIHALEMDAHRRRDEEAAMIRNNAPSIGNQIELLQMASGLWREFGHPERAASVGELAEQLALESRRSRRTNEPRRGLRDEDRRRIQEMQEQVERLQRALQDMQRRLRGDGERGR